jgi:Protein of unknown function (DUF664)
MAEPDPKADLCHYLKDARDALLWKLEGLSEYDIRRPLVATGANLLGLVKHLAGVEMGTSAIPSAPPNAAPAGTSASRRRVGASSRMIVESNPQSGG